MERFDECLPFVLAREGGKVDDPADRGGRTAYGITQRVFDDWRRVGRGSEPRDVWEITPAQVAAIYRARYWAAVRADELPEKLDLAMFDAAVNHGPVRAIKFLQRALGVEADGVFGAHTAWELNADVRAGALPELLDAYIGARRSFYEAIVERDPTQRKFAGGWENRLVALSKELGATA